MTYLRFDPPYHLRKYIRFFWTFESDDYHDIPFEHWSVACGASKLVFQYKGSVTWYDHAFKPQKVSAASIQAQTQKACRFVSSGPVGILGVYFHPGALAILFSLPAHEINNQVLSLAALIGRLGVELEEKVIMASSTLERIQVISAFLEGRLTSVSNNELAVLALLGSISNGRGLLPIKQLVYQHHLSQRQLERNFKTVSGFSPKALSRIIRFENSIQLFLDNPSLLTQTAYTSGYFDQSHFIRDFKEFSGKQPTTYFSQDLEIFRNL